MMFDVRFPSKAFCSAWKLGTPLSASTTISPSIHAGGTCVARAFPFRSRADMVQFRCLSRTEVKMSSQGRRSTAPLPDIRTRAQRPCRSAPCRRNLRWPASYPPSSPAKYHSPASHTDTGSPVSGDSALRRLRSRPAEGTAGCSTARRLAFGSNGIPLITVQRRLSSPISSWSSNRS